MPSDRFVRWRHLTLVALLVAAVLIAAGCGGDDDDGDSEPSSVAIEATGGEGGISFTAPDEVPAGAAEIEFTNSTDIKDDFDAQLVYTSEEHTDEEVAAELRKAFQGQPVAEWFEGGGGVGSTARGETGTATQELREGTYYVVGGPDPAQPPLTKFTVTAGEDGAELPETEGTVTAQDYSFTGEGLTAGSNPVLLENAGAQWHHFYASRIAEGATIEEVREFIQSEGEGQGPPPLTEENQAQSTVLEGGTSQVVDLELEPGRYAFFCFISDKQGGPPHVAQGMVSEVTVEG
jgi:hypothetical protein